ncbi:hypothetical protein BZZ01_32660 [Nostocales cyanobacterium HT-58-2]|nr:hypothetical protein BZZ01_32660 [Nostocales cyanobacterium HT-58-2]
MPKVINKKSIQIASQSIPMQILSSTPGRLRLRVAPSHRQVGEMQRIASALEADPNVNQVRTNIQNGSIVIYHGTQDASLDNIFATLQDLGIILGNITIGKTDAAAEVSNAAADLNNRVKQATNNAVDLRILFPLGLAILAIRQFMIQGLRLERIPWYVLAWYAFDSFIKLHGTNNQQHSSSES